MHLKNVCQHYCVQMTILIQGTIGKSSLEKEHPLFTEFVLILNSCSIQYNALLVDYVQVAKLIILFCQEQLDVWQFQIKVIIFDV